MTMRNTTTWVIAATAVGSMLTAVGCSSRQATMEGGDRAGRAIVRVEGSDTMVNLAQAWAEEFSKSHPDISVQVSGGGSGVGIASLIEGVADLANASRTMKDKEIQRAEQNTGQTPREVVVATDALAVYVHKDNPLETISIEELAEIYGEDGTITQWSQLGVQNVACKSDDIKRVSRQNNSGTYHYFREAVLGDNRDYKLGSIDQSGSKDVVALVSRTPCAIGYSGMGYRTDEVKWLKIAKSKGESGVEPSVESAKDGSYPIARPLQVYTLGEPTGPVKEYLDWILSDEGQRIVLDLGYVPIKELGAAAPGDAGEDAESGDSPAEDGPEGEAGEQE
jgi:phosphate transport system substrate-binding protein